MSRVKEVDATTEAIKTYFKLMDECGVDTDARNYLTPIVSHLGDISMSLAVIADKLSEEPEEEEDENERLECYTCHYWETPP